ncbi:MAG: insulinase family protein [Candidatus Omnitrophica bacterium]|nr:insulinase family protein [Candidatus Omnitrophota bacterium]
MFPPIHPARRGVHCLLVATAMMTIANASIASAADDRRQVGQLLLDNGLQAAWEADHRQPLVAIEARIKGGLRGEGRYVGSGITHFIEHMLFKGTPSRPPGTIDQEVRRYGGSINAFTSFDTTGVSLYVESRHLKDALALLADILQHAMFEQPEFDKERAVIISELQMNLDDPDRRLSQTWFSRHFLEHPYRHPILGYRPLLERLTVEDLRTFYAAQYQPQQITLACVGDVDAAAMPGLLKEHFGAWPRGMTDPSQQLVPMEPPPATRKDAVIELPVQSAYGMLGFSSTRLTDPALYPLDVLANILGEGRSSRLYESLLRAQHIVHAITAWNYTPYDPGAFVIQFRTDPEKTEAAIAAILDQLQQITEGGVTAAELDKAKNSVSAGYIFARQTIEAKAGDLATSMAATGDPLFSARYVRGIQQVTAAAVQEAARRFCDPSTMTTAVIRPPRPAVAPTMAQPLAAPMPVTKTRLPSGATALIGADHTLPIAAIVIAFRGGLRAETEDTEGLSYLVAQLLTKGTARHSAFEIARQIESLGGTLEPFSGRDGFGVSVQLLSKDVEQGLALAHELITQSTFPEEELQIARGLMAKQLDAQDDEIFDVGGRLLRQTLFGQHPYRLNPLGDRRTLHRLGRTQCLEFSTRWMSPSNSVIAVFGDIDPSAAAQQLNRLFGAAGPANANWPERLPEETVTTLRTATRAMDREQAVIMLGFLGNTYASDDRYGLDVMTAVLSGMSGRLFQSVREQHGLSYTLGAVNVPGWDPGYVMIYAATRPQDQDKVLHVLDEQLRLAAARGFTPDEVEQAKRFLIGAHRMEVQHLIGLSKRAALDELYGVGCDAWRSYEAKINGITVSMVNAAAKRYLTIGRHAQVIISPNGHSR